MPRLGKREKWKRNQSLRCVLEPDLPVPGTECFEHRGRWAAEIFGNHRPIVLELGCGKGRFTLFMAQQFPERNFIGLDLKGHRFWTGADEAERLGITNVVYLRAAVQEIERYFGPEEISEFWLTFSDPQPKDGTGRKRITSARFVERYRRIAAPGAHLHIKTDSALVHDLALEELGPDFLLQSRDVHGPWIETVPEPLQTLLRFQTHYEQRWIREGRKIHYLGLELSV